MSSSPLRVTEEQVAAAQLRIILDKKLNRHTPDIVRRIAAMTGVDSAEDSRTDTLPSSVKMSVPTPELTFPPTPNRPGLEERTSADPAITEPLGVSVSSASPVFIQTLGMFRVFHNGIPIPRSAWKSKKAIDLLKILVARRRPTSRDQLMELLWPDSNPTVASNRLAVLLSTVRDVLPAGKNYLTATDGAVALNPAHVSVDVENFLTQATAALDAHRTNAPNADEQLKAALDAHTGDFLEAEPYHDWAATTAEEVRAIHIALLRAITTRRRDAGDTDAVVRYTLRLLERDPYDERAYLTLIMVLLHAGRLGEAHRYYLTYIRRMNEIDVPPRQFPNMTSREVDAE